MVPPKSTVFWRLFNASTRGHVAVFRLTGGRVGGSVPGIAAPMMLLHHRGAKSGKERV